MSGSVVKIQGHPTRRQVITVAMAHSVATRSCAPWRTEDESGPPKALIATYFHVRHSDRRLAGFRAVGMKE